MPVIGENRGYTRKDQRISEVELNITPNDRKYRTADWSFSGFRINRYVGPLRTNDTALVTSIGRRDGVSHAVLRSRFNERLRA